MIECRWDIPRLKYDRHTIGWEGSADRRSFFDDRDKSGEVLFLILDLSLEYMEPIELCCESTTDRCCSWLTSACDELSRSSRIMIDDLIRDTLGS